jgi:hypothetical protein
MQGPAQIEKPTSVTVFGVLNIIFGTLGLLCAPFGLVGVVAGGKTLNMIAPYKMFLLFTNIVSLGLSIWLLVLGIGLVTMKSWARSGSVIYACVAIAWTVVGAAMSILALSLGWISPPQGQMAGFIGGMCGGLIGGLVYPLLLLIFMQMENVKQAFKAAGE